MKFGEQENKRGGEYERETVREREIEKEQRIERDEERESEGGIYRERERESEGGIYRERERLLTKRIREVIENILISIKINSKFTNFMK